MGFFTDVLKVGAGILIADRLVRGYERRCKAQADAIDTVLRECGDVPTARTVAPTPTQLLGPSSRPETPPKRRLFRFR